MQPRPQLRARAFAGDVFLHHYAPCALRNIARAPSASFAKRSTGRPFSPFRRIFSLLRHFLRVILIWATCISAVIQSNPWRINEKLSRSRRLCGNVIKQVAEWYMDVIKTDCIYIISRVLVDCRFFFAIAVILMITLFIALTVSNEKRWIVLCRKICYYGKKSCEVIYNSWLLLWLVMK